MRYPSKVRITAKQAYEVVWVDEFVNPENVGECRLNSKQIVLKKGENKLETESTFLHELLHCIEFEYKLKIPHQVIYDLEGPLLKVLKLNGWVKK